MNQFVLEWKWCMFEALIMIIFEIFLGVRQRYMTSNLETKGRYNNNLFALVATVGTIIFGLMVFFNVNEETAFWPVVLNSFAIVVISLAFFLALYGIAVLASWAHEGYLCNKRREIIRERKNRAKIAKDEGKVVEGNFKSEQKVQSSRALHCV